MSRKPRTTMSELQRALSRARLPHLELVKLVGRGYFLKDTSGTWRATPTELMPARDMLTYLNGLSHGAAESHRAAEDCSHCKELTSVIKSLLPMTVGGA